MKSKISLLMAVVLIAFATTQCRKKKTEEPADEEPTPTTPATTFTAISQVFASLGAPTQTFTMNATTASTFNTGGVLVEVPSNAFIDPTTSLTATGNVTITVRSIRTKPEIIFSGAGANTTSSRLISTKGCVKVTASQNTQSLRMGTSGTVTVNVPDPSGVTPMKKYYAPKITASDSTIVWDLGTDVTDIPMGTISTVNHHRANLDSLKWLNVGVIWDTIGGPAKQAETVTVNGSMFNKTNCAIFISFNNHMIVGALTEISSGTFRIANIPPNKGVHFFGIAVINGQYYSALMSTQTGAISNGLNMQPKTLSQIQAEVASIP